MLKGFSLLDKLTLRIGGLEDVLKRKRALKNSDRSEYSQNRCEENMYFL